MCSLQRLDSAVVINLPGAFVVQNVGQVVATTEPSIMVSVAKGDVTKKKEMSNSFRVASQARRRIAYITA